MVVSDKELVRIEKSLTVGKVTGLADIQNLVTKAAIAEAPIMVRSTMQRCLDEDRYSLLHRSDRVLF